MAVRHLFLDLPATVSLVLERESSDLIAAYPAPTDQLYTSWLTEIALQNRTWSEVLALRAKDPPRSARENGLCSRIDRLFERRVQSCGADVARCQQMVLLAAWQHPQGGRKVQRSDWNLREIADIVMARWLSEDRGPVFLVCRYPEAYLEAKSLRLLPNVEIVSFDD